MNADANDPLSPLESLPVESIALLCDWLRDLADAIENRHCARLINHYHRSNERNDEQRHHREHQLDCFDDDRPPF